MKEKLRFRPVSTPRITETGEYQKEVQKSVFKFVKTEKENQQYLELTIYDVLLEQITLPVKFKVLDTEVKEESKPYLKLTIYDVWLEQRILATKFEILNTEVKEVAIKQTTSLLFDTLLTKQIIKPAQIPATGLIQVSVPKEASKMADIKLSTVKIEQLSPSLYTDIAKNIQMNKTKTESFISSFNVELKSKTLLKQNSDLDTELLTPNIIRSIEETLASSEGQNQLPIFEEFINCDKRFPRSFSESFNSPFVVLIGESEYKWHIPIIYVLKELFCEITDKHPRVTFREPELFEEGVEEIVDSLDSHSLEQFTFEYKIEFLDARKTQLAVAEFAKMVRGRLKSGFLQQFGVLVVAIKNQEDLNKVKNALKFEGLRVYTCQPEDTKYEEFCSKILGVSSLGKFFTNLRKYQRYLDNTHRRFSIFVKRDIDTIDKLQYPLKVATFVYLLNELRNRKKKVINNFEELCGFVNEILEKEIKVETPISEGRVIPDLIYVSEEGEIYVEIETLLGTFEPLKKIDETVEKYRDISNAIIWIVIKPVSAIIHYEELKVRNKAYKILYNDKKIDFKVLTLLTSGDKFKWDLVNIDDFVRGKKCQMNLKR